jgi:DivIVA domain-containing protein
VTSQGQRFRRRALRRGYKVDEVDAFLDRVEATLSGETIGAPVSAQEVHDVVFRVRFGGYDEWQVDLHLDRVERQLADLEERAGGFARAADPRMGPPERMGAPERMGPPPERMGAPERMGPPPERMGAPERMGPPMPERPMRPRPVQSMPVQAGPPDPAYGRYDEPTYGGGGFEGPGGTFDGFEPGRHGKTDMTAEIRMPERDQIGPSPGLTPPGMGGPPMGPPATFTPPMGLPGRGAPMGVPGSVPAGDLQRIDQLRRTFQPRRFGSGYDPAQVDRLFEGIIAAMSSRGPVAINDAELDAGQFSLVPGGYFEAEVDSALKEVRDILRRR